MAVSKKLKKGGEARYVIQGASNNDFFTVPRGFHIRYLGIENLSNLATSGTVTLGKVPGTYTTCTFAVTGPFTSSTQAMSWTGGAAGTITATAAVVTAATAATSAAYIASQSPVMSAAGLGANWIVVANGANITMISSVPGNFTAVTISLGSSGLTIGSITTVAGSLDTTYMPSTPIAGTFGAITNLTPALVASYSAVTSQAGTTLSATFTSAAGAAGTYYLGGNSSLNSSSQYNTGGPGAGNVLTQSAQVGSPISIPNGLSALATGFYMGGCGYYQYTIATSGTGTYFVNGVSIAGSATPATLATNIGAAIIPGWAITVSSATVTCYSLASGYVPQPTLVLGTATVLTTSSVTWLPGYTLPGYILANATSVTNTVTVAAVAAAAGKVAFNGYPIQIPNSCTAANGSAICAGTAAYIFTISSSSSGTNGLTIDGVTYGYTSSATPATTATAIAALVVPGWTITAASTIVSMLANVGNVIHAQPTFVAGAAAVPVLTANTFNPGIYVPGYSVTYSSSTAVWVGAAPMFTILVAPGTQTYSPVMSFAGSTGSMTISVNQNLNPGAAAPVLSGALTTQTYTQSTVSGDVPYYINFSQPDPQSNVNVYALLEKMN